MDLDAGRLLGTVTDRADGQRGRLRSLVVRRNFALLVLGALVSLTLLAYASSPDPLWIEGAYDGDDADDVVEAATSMAGGHDGARPRRPEPCGNALGLGLPAPQVPRNGGRR